MTTLVVVKKAGYVVIAGDSLTTFGGVKLLPDYDKSHDKILHAHGTYFGIAGSAAHHLVMESILTKNTEMKLGSKMEIFETFRTLPSCIKRRTLSQPKRRRRRSLRIQPTHVAHCEQGRYLRRVFDARSI